MSERVSVAELRKLAPEYDHSGQAQKMTAQEFATGVKAWDRPLTDTELTEEVHNFMPRVIAAFRANGCECEYHTYDPRKCRQGFPDLVICHEGLLVVAELKVGKNKPDAEQKRWLDHFVDCNIEGTFLWYPSDWDTICKIATAEMGCYSGDAWYDEPSRWVNRRAAYVKGKPRG